MELTKMYTVEEAARILGVSERTIYRALRAGLMSCHRIGKKQLRFTEEDIRSMVTAEPAAPKKEARMPKSIVTKI